VQVCDPQAKFAIELGKKCHAGSKRQFEACPSEVNRSIP
jgi:hypothetical protein